MTRYSNSISTLIVLQTVVCEGLVMPRINSLSYLDAHGHFIIKMTSIVVIQYHFNWMPISNIDVLFPPQFSINSLQSGRWSCGYALIAAQSVKENVSMQSEFDLRCAKEICKAFVVPDNNVHNKAFVVDFGLRDISTYGFCCLHSLY